MLEQPRRSDGSRQHTSSGKKMSFWRKLWLTIQIDFVVVIIASCVLSCFIYRKRRWSIMRGPRLTT